MILKGGTGGSRGASKEPSSLLPKEERCSCTAAHPGQGTREDHDPGSPCNECVITLLVFCQFNHGSAAVGQTHQLHPDHDMHAQGPDRGEGSRTTSPSPGSAAGQVAAVRGGASRSTSPAGPSVQIHSEVGDAISTKRRSPEPLAGVESCHGSSKALSYTCGHQTTTARAWGEEAVTERSPT